MELDDFKHILENEAMIMVYFSSEYCNVCKALYPKIESLIKNEFPQIKLIKLLAKDCKEIFGQNQIFSIPTVIVYFNGKEYIRKVRNFSVTMLKQEISKPYNLFFE